MRYALAICLLLSAAGCATSGSRREMIVIAPVTDLRARPHTTAKIGHDPDQESQLLYGELVRVVSRDQGWAQIEAVEQPEWSHAKRWQGYPGWVKASDLAPANVLMAPTMVITERWAESWFDAYTKSRSPWWFPMGACLRATDMGGALWRVELPDGATVWVLGKDASSLQGLKAQPVKQKRRNILAAAARLLGEPYYWGGRSTAMPGADHAPLGVDCSGLTNLAYRVSGVDIPRDAHEQFLRSRRIAAPEPADLIFLSKEEQPEQIVHVMLYAGKGEVIEGPGTGMVVRRIPLQERLGRPLEQLPSGTVVDGQTVYFGSYFRE